MMLVMATRGSLSSCDLEFFQMMLDRLNIYAKPKPELIVALCYYFRKYGKRGMSLSM